MIGGRRVERLKQFISTSAAIVIACACTQAFAACDDHTPRSTPTADFEFLAGGAVVHHRKTGLEWQRCPEGMVFSAGAADHTQDTCRGTADTFAHEGAMQLPARVNAAGRDGFSDWRLPTMAELASIVEGACQVPAVNTTVFPDTPVTWFWADAPVALSPGPGYAWGIGFGAGGYYVGNPDHGAVRLVRGGGK